MEAVIISVLLTVIIMVLINRKIDNDWKNSMEDDDKTAYSLGFGKRYQNEKLSAGINPHCGKKLSSCSENLPHFHS